MALEVVPVTWHEIESGVRAWHRHLSRGLTGNRFGAGLVDVAAPDDLVAVACAGTPARVWTKQRKIAITRVAVAPGVDVRENACSRLYGALCGATQRLGYLEAWTYTLMHEPGTSLRAANFEDMGLTDGGEWDRPSRARRKADRPEPKRRWRRVLCRQPSDEKGSGR